MDYRVSDLLRKFGEITTKNHATHAVLFPTIKYFKIAGNKKKEFWIDYCKEVNKNSNDYNAMNICEVVTDKAPFTVILKLKFQATDKEIHVNDKFLEELVYYLQESFTQVLDITDKDNIYAISLLKSKIYKGKDTECIDIRLHAPYCITEKEVQEKVRDSYVKILRSSNVQRHLGTGVFGDWNDFIQKINWEFPLYGSTSEQKGLFLEYYSTYGVIDSDLIESDLEDALTDDILELPKVYFVHLHRDIEDDKSILDDDYFFKDCYIDDGENSAHYDVEESEFKRLLPFLLSLRYKGIDVTYAKNDEYEVKSYNYSHASKLDGASVCDPEDSQSEISEQLIKMLNHSRFTSECYWVDIGKAFYHSNEGKENGVRAWIHNTIQHFPNKNYPDFMLLYGSLESTCNKEYEGFGTSNITIKTIAWYAKHDNSRDYIIWSKNWVKSLCTKALSLTDNDVAKTFYRAYWLDFIYAPGITGKGKWFEYKAPQSRWVENPEGLCIQLKLSSNFLRKFEELRTEMSIEVTQCGENLARKEDLEYSIKKVSNLISKLKTNNYKASVVRECKLFFSDNEFLNSINDNANLTGVLNGVIEVNNINAIYRGGKPEDFMTMSTNIKYNENLSYDHQEVKDLLYWFKQVFVDEDLINYFIKFCASCLKAGNGDKIFWIWSGCGNNSKSMIVKLFEAAFGQYCMKTAVVALTEKGGNAGSASPHIARTKNKRTNFYEEPEDDVNLQKGIVKRATGGDSQYARLLNENGGEIKATTKTIMLCNKIPNIPGFDTATKNRLRVLPFDSSWYDDASNSIEEQWKMRKFKIDINFERKIPGMAAAFLWLCTNNFEKYTKEGLITPQCVLEKTRKYWEEQDIYAQFINDRIMTELCKDGSPNTKFKLSITDAYEDFKSWYRDNFPGKPAIERTIFRTDINNRWGRPKGNLWYGFRLMDENDIIDTKDDPISNATAEKKEASAKADTNVPQSIFGGASMFY